MSFVCVFAFTTNYNFNVDNTAFLRLIGIEKSQIMVTYYGEDAPKVFEEIGKMEHIRKTIRRNAINIPIRYENRELSPNVSISNDYEHVETNTIVKGRYPIHDNEIAMTGLVLKQLKAKLGDVVRVGGEGIEQEFIIVGMTQHISNLGKGANITEDGMKRINPDYIPSGLYVYIDQKENTASVMKAIEKQYSNLQIDISNREKNFETILASFNSAITMLCIACFIITLSIITLILYLLIKIKIMKERMRLGVAKALGYTTGQLVLQMIVSFCPVCILGALVGTILATYLTNPAFALILSISGIQNCHFIINPLLTLITFLFISAYSILITAIVARSIRKITPRELFL
jgi:Cell division protein